jgi:hypothetical protein
MTGSRTDLTQKFILAFKNGSLSENEGIALVKEMHEYIKSQEMHVLFSKKAREQIPNGADIDEMMVFWMMFFCGDRAQRYKVEETIDFHFILVAQTWSGDGRNWMRATPDLQGCAEDNVMQLVINNRLLEGVGHCEWVSAEWDKKENSLRNKEHCSFCKADFKPMLRHHHAKQNARTEKK